MTSPTADHAINGISTPPATASAPNPSPPAYPSTQPATQSPQRTNGATNGATASFPETSLQDSGSSRRPRDARLVHLILANMGVHAYTQRVPLQLLDFAYRYTSSILTDAISYEPPAHALATSKKRGADKTEEDGGISLNALRTAVGARAATSFSGQLSKEFMAEVASERNRVALPKVEREFGLRLPPERYCFTGIGWSVKEAWETDEDMDNEEEMELGEENVALGLDRLADGEVNGAGDTTMGGMEAEDEQDEDEFEEAMGMRLDEKT